MTNEAEVYFALYGSEFDLEEATRRIGIEPTSIKRKGEPKTRKHLFWQISPDRIEGDIIDIYEMSSALVAQLAPFAEKIASTRQALGLEAVLEVVLWISTDESKSTPAIGFDHEVISFLQKVGATIDVDTYCNAP
ncbi:DUF4279 domain-containing protein [Hydrogenophaga sp. SL48]|uniref:DUF4279 domain-containing protein n=1 Tax=Hydrogenophaga sp. SL48 TaxID=2806347 RepID=UPI001F1F90E0|nr:DUF4279 domain-containing protein [Hydrogenophaga sp. SL48]UJW81277.1 DUF4279 domain-containing protein [Hydrogenophaga sp. SL48]